MSKADEEMEDQKKYENWFKFLRGSEKAINRYCRKSEFIFSGLNKKIYHYTDLHGMQGIIKNKGFWLTDSRFLNDRDELIDGKKLVNELIERLKNKKRYERFKNILSLTQQELNKEATKLTYICSFSTESDSLEQWRSYGKNGAGICIEFDPSIKTKYPHFNLLPQYRLTKVIYKKHIKLWIILSIIFAYKHEYLKDETPDLNYYEKDYASYLAGSLQFTFSYFKNEAFASENEVRIIDLGAENHYSETKYRISNGTIIPYVETFNGIIYDESKNRIDPDELPIKKIIVGPTANKELTLLGVKDFIKRETKGCPIEVVSSSIPFRG